MKNMASLHRRVLNALYYVAFYACFPLIIILYIASAIFKPMMKGYLKLKYGDRFGGMLSSEIVFYPPDKVAKSLISVVIVIDIKSTPFEDFISQLKSLTKKKIFDCPKDYSKLTCTVSQNMWYSYLLKDDVSVDDCIYTIDVTTDASINETTFKETLNNVCNRPLPKNNKVLWEIVIPSKPVKCHINGQENSNSCYALIAKCNHIVGDGLSLIAVVADIMEIKTFPESFFVDNMDRVQKEYAKHSMSPLKIMLTFIYVILISPAVVLYQYFLRREENNMFYTGELAPENFYVQKVETTDTLFNMVKRIKSVVPNVTFTDIFLTAVSASLETLFKNNYHHSPRFITAIMTALMKPPFLDKKPVLENIFVAGHMNFPINTGPATMVEKLSLVKKHRDVLIQSRDYMVSHLVMNVVMNVVPKLLVEPVANLGNATIIITNLPGPPKVTVLNDCSVENLTAFVPTAGKLGATLALLTYDNKFQLGFSVNKALISQEKAEAFLDDIFHKLYLLNDEVQKMNCS